MSKNKHGCLWWLLIGWWWLPVKCICLYFFELITRHAQVYSSTDPEPPKVEPTPSAPPKKTETHRLAGENYYLDAIRDLMVENSVYSWSKKELIDDGYVDERIYEFDVYSGVAVLEPEPDNPHDPRAIKVLTDGIHIGYIKAGSCAHIHKLLREGSIETARVEIKGGKYKILNEEYDDYTDKTTYTLERGSIPLSAVVTLTLK